MKLVRKIMYLDHFWSENGPFLIKKHQIGVTKIPGRIGHETAQISNQDFSATIEYF